MLPDSEHGPAGSAQLHCHGFISFTVALKLWSPIRFILLRRLGATRTAVPKATIDEYRNPLGAEDEVRASRQLLVSTPAGNMGASEDSNKTQLRARVSSRANGGHYL